MTKIGIGINEWSARVPQVFAHACESLQIPYQFLDFKSMTNSHLTGLTHLSPALFLLKPNAIQLYREAESNGIILLNPMASVEIADDKAKTYSSLEKANIPQVQTDLIELSEEAMLNYFEKSEKPTVFKMRHGGQGRWVRLVRDREQIRDIYIEFMEEGIGPILAQPFIEEAKGESVRVIVTGGKFLVAAKRLATSDWRSNIALGASQEICKLTTPEKDLAVSATNHLRLGHAGVDLIQTKDGFKVLEVNACPDFTSMEKISPFKIEEEVIRALIKAIDL